MTLSLVAWTFGPNLGHKFVGDRCTNHRRCVFNLLGLEFLDFLECEFGLAQRRHEAAKSLLMRRVRASSLAFDLLGLELLDLGLQHILGVLQVDDLLLCKHVVVRLGRLLRCFRDLCSQLLDAQLVLLCLLLILLDSASVRLDLLGVGLSFCLGLVHLSLRAFHVPAVHVELVGELIALLLKHIVRLNQAFALL